jgi:hypothetical protein
MSKINKKLQFHPGLISALLLNIMMLYFYTRIYHANFSENLMIWTLPYVILIMGITMAVGNKKITFFYVSTFIATLSSFATPHLANMLSNTI